MLQASQERASNGDADLEVFAFVDHRGAVSESLTNATLWRQSGAMAAALLKQVHRGDKVLMVYTPGIDFVVAFLACLRAELVAVPIPPPDLTQNGSKAQEESRKFIAIAKDSGAVAVLTNKEYNQAKNMKAAMKWIQSWVWSDSSNVTWPDLLWIVTNDLRFGSETLPPQDVDPPLDRVAFLQYTSGSTSQPKGVRITFGNMKHQLEANADILNIKSTSCNVCWMPHFHDFALISHIASIFSGNGRLIMLSPLTFLAKPILWLELVGRYSATHLACPPFALSMLVRKTTPQQRAALQLHSITSLLVAADTIKGAAIKEFCDAFSESGFRPSMIQTAYGLAEHCVGITMTTAQKPVTELPVDSDILFSERRIEIVPSSPYSIVSCGAPMPGVAVRIVDQDQVQPEGYIGEVWADSDSKADGYDGQPELSRATFQARLEGDTELAYLRTGDLGFLWKGQLYITGRLKEIIKLYGRTLHPVDIELCATQAHSLLRPGSVCAIAVSHPQDGSDRLVIVAEVQKGREPDHGTINAIVDAVRQAILETFSVSCHAVILGRPGQLVRKTTSGKIQRALLRTWYLEGRLARPTETSLRSPISNALLYAPSPLASGRRLLPPSPTMAVQMGQKTVSSRSFSFQMTALGHTHDDRMRRLCAAVHDAGFAAEIRQLVELNTAVSSQRNQLQRKCPYQKRAFHAEGVGARGDIQMSLIGNDLFSLEEKRGLKAAVRFSNVLFSDDRHPQIRGAALRIYAGDDIDRPLMDFIFQSGDGRDLFPSTRLALEIFKDNEYVMGLPPSHPLRDAHRSAIRQVPGSYADLHYFGVHTYSWHSTHWARFRFRHRDCHETLPPYSNDQNCDLLDLRPAPEDNRAHDFLRTSFLNESLSGGGERYVVEVQIRPKSKDDAVDFKMQDGLVLWDDTPWQLFAEVALDDPLPDDVTESLRFNICNSPIDIEIVAGSDADHPASSGQCRAITYAIASSIRRGVALPDYLASFVQLKPSPAMLLTTGSDMASAQCSSVVVIGAGSSGLAVAMALERRGYQVTVLEAAANVGGKASSIYYDQKVFDWGGHLCNNSYYNVRALVNRFELEIEPAAPPHLFNCKERRSTICNIFQNGDETDFFQRAIRSMTEDFGVRDRVSTPLSIWAGAMKVPWRKWIEADSARKKQLWPVILQMNSCGYGFSLDHQIPLAFLAKLVAVSDEFRSVGWTLKAGMQSLYDAMADNLNDIRLNSPVAGIERRDGSVQVRLSSGEVFAADYVVSSLSLPHTIALLDSPSETELSVAGAVRTFCYYTTIARCRGLEQFAIGFHVMDVFNEPDQAAGSIGHVVAWHKRYTDCNIYLFYSFAPDLQSGDAVQRLLQKDVKEILDGDVIEILNQRAFDFFPYATEPDHFYPKLAEIQGHERLWHVGSICNIELMEGNLSFGQRLVRENFPPVEPSCFLSPSPSSMPVMHRELTTTERFIVDSIFAECPEIDIGPGAVAPTDKIASLGITSISLPALANTFSKYTGTRVRLIDCAIYPTVQALGAFLDRVRDQTQLQTFQFIKHIRSISEEGGEGSNSILFMVHDGLGRTHQYVNSSHYPLSLIQPYWEAHNATLLTSLDEVAALYVGQIRAARPQGPWRLGGYSLGAMLAWRMAQMLGVVDRLILIDCPCIPPLLHEAVADANVIRLLQSQFSDMEHFEYSRALTDQIPKNPVLPGQRSGPTLVIVGSKGVVQDMKLANTDELKQSWGRAIGSELSFVNIEGANHTNIMLAPYADQVHSAIEQFLH